MYSFYAYLSRMRYIRRWSLMRNTQEENILEHSLQCAHIAHALAVIKNARHGGDADPARAAELAVFHDAPEVITGDLPTPVKYFNPEIAKAYRGLEAFASKRLLELLPTDLRAAYEPLLVNPQEEPEWPRVKAADKLCAYIKCLEEERAGNGEFRLAKQTILADLNRNPLPEVLDFIENFLPPFLATLDELNGRNSLS